MVGSICISDMGVNIFVIEFQSMHDLLKVKRGCHRCLIGIWLSLKIFIVMHLSRRCLIRNLFGSTSQPSSGMNQMVWEKVGLVFGSLEMFDLDTNDIGWGKYLRVKVLIALTKP